ncbi:HNH endonuclease [Paenibacillus tianjinensis]|uniref:HNH endonuclease n=1 Tax=Paenibacillus tianjinensis TaxID=2810347 RepID=A0ABX7L5Q9_9BACL|nr:HNH endonuclease [Paenibacillus tianjinensis]QSF43437.1 HNH endonuclease [Paenibacillus tianjinensis]
MTYEECHKIIDGVDHKLCNICIEWFPCNNDFYYLNSKNMMDGHYPYCKKCGVEKACRRQKEQGELALRYRKDHYQKNKESTLKTNKKWRDVNKDKVKDIIKKFYDQNPEKHKEYHDNHHKHIIDNHEWDECRIYFNFRCAYCGKTWEQNKKETKKGLHKEHVDDDGANDLSNCVPACRDCNSNKWCYDFESWYSEDNPIYSLDRKRKILKWINEDHKKYIINYEYKS